MFLLYPFYVVLSLSITVFAWIISPILALLPDKDGNLPKWLYYFQTFDDVVTPGYWEGLKWLCRNPAYGFDLFVFGMKYDPSKWRKIYDHDGMLLMLGDKGAFSFIHHNGTKRWWLPSFKLGWKAFNFTDKDHNPIAYGMAGLNRGRIPLCFTLFVNV